MGRYKWGYLGFLYCEEFYRVQGLGVVIGGVINPLIWAITTGILLITKVATHERMHACLFSKRNFLWGLRFSGGLRFL